MGVGVVATGAVGMGLAHAWLLLRRRRRRKESTHQQRVVPGRAVRGRVAQQAAPLSAAQVESLSAPHGPLQRVQNRVSVWIGGAAFGV